MTKRPANMQSLRERRRGYRWAESFVMRRIERKINEAINGPRVVAARVPEARITGVAERDPHQSGDHQISDAAPYRGPGEDILHVRTDPAILELCRRAVEFRDNDKRTDEEKIADGVRFITDTRLGGE